MPVPIHNASSMHDIVQPQYTMHSPSQPGIMGGPQSTAQGQSSQTKDESAIKGSQESPTEERGTSLKAYMGGPQPTAQGQSSQTKDESGNKGSQESPTGEGTSLKAYMGGPQPTGAQGQSSQTKDESGTNKGSQERPSTGKRGTSLKEYLEMLRDERSTRATSIAAHCLMWIAFGGFLFLPGSFPKIDKILKDSSGTHSEKKDFTRYVPL